ncbi:MAG: NUDIX domain-containing protein [Nanoarchaeota archaeon]|nr:MAG: NUDIX domain-containing protein [Nanoarchaeota archaeon]
MKETSQVAVDPVIFTIDDSKLKVLLEKREKPPFEEMLELPGGLLENNESAEETLKRKLNALLGTNDILLTQFHTFTNPKRDPRGRVVSIGFIALVSNEIIKSKESWHDVKGSNELAFDHKKIIEKAQDYLKKNIDTLIVKQFMPKYFTLNNLQKVYEIIEDRRYDNRNFRKKMISNGIVEKTKRTEEEVSHRPGTLYRFSTRVEIEGKKSAFGMIKGMSPYKKERFSDFD